MKQESLKDRQKELLLRYRNEGDQQALLDLIKTCGGLITSYSKRMSWLQMSREDLEAECVLGIINAANKYDLSRDTLFGALASMYIRERMDKVESFSSAAASIKRNRSERATRWQLLPLLRKYEEQGMERRQAIKKAAQDLNITERHADQFLSRSIQFSIGGTDYFDDEAGTGEAFAFTCDAITAEEEHQERTVSKVMAEITADLDPLDADIVQLHIIERQSMGSIAKRHATSRERVSKRRDAVIVLLRKKLEARGLTAADLL